MKDEREWHTEGLSGRETPHEYERLARPSAFGIAVIRLLADRYGRFPRSAGRSATH